MANGRLSYAPPSTVNPRHPCSDNRLQWRRFAILVRTTTTDGEQSPFLHPPQCIAKRRHLSHPSPSMARRRCSRTQHHLWRTVAISRIHRQLWRYIAASRTTTIYGEPSPSLALPSSTASPRRLSHRPPSLANPRHPLHYHLQRTSAVLAPSTIYGEPSPSSHLLPFMVNPAPSLAPTTDYGDPSPSILYTEHRPTIPQMMSFHVHVHSEPSPSLSTP